MSAFSRPGEVFDFTYLSLGAGVQSSGLLVCSALGLHDVPRADLAVFADTGDEPQWVYDYLDVLEEFGEAHGIPVHRTSRGKLSEWMIDRQKAGQRFVSVPLYTLGADGAREGMLRRQCTREFKVEPLEKFVRKALGYEPRKRIRLAVRCLMGISIDEAGRMRPSRTRWITNRYPLVEAGITRARALEICVEAGLPEPRRSSCVYCPYHDNATWLDLRDNHPEEWEKAVAFDDAIRDMTMAGRERPAFVHRSCVPLKNAELDDHKDQADLFLAECEGMCGV